MDEDLKYLADILQNSHSQSEIAYVEGWQDQFDDPKMAVALLQGLPTGLTLAMLAGDAHARIERAVDFGGTVSCEIEQFPVAYFEDALINDILTRAVLIVRAGFSPDSA